MTVRKRSRQLALRREKAVRSARLRVMRAKVHRNALDRAKAKSGSDGKTAQILHTTPQRISDYRKGRRHLGPEQAARLAYFLGEPIFTAVAHALAFSTRRRQSREFWLSFSSGTWPGADVSYRRWADSNSLLKYPIWGG